MGGCISPASSVKLDSGFSCRALAAWSSFSGRDSSRPHSSSRRMAASYSWAGVHHLGGVGVVAVAPAVDLVFQFFLQLGLHNPHGGYRSAQQREKILNGVALLEIQHTAAAPIHKLGIDAQHLLNEGRGLPAHKAVGSGELQMVALGRVRHRTPRQKRPSEKGNFTAVLLQHPQVHVEGHGVLPAEAVGLLDGPQLFRRPDAKTSLGSQGLGRAVKGEAKGLPGRAWAAALPIPGSP